MSVEVYVRVAGSGSATLHGPLRPGEAASWIGWSGPDGITVELLDVNGSRLRPARRLFVARESDDS